MCHLHLLNHGRLVLHRKKACPQPLSVCPMRSGTIPSQSRNDHGRCGGASAAARCAETKNTGLQNLPRDVVQSLFLSKAVGWQRFDPSHRVRGCHGERAGIPVLGDSVQDMLGRCPAPHCHARQFDTPPADRLSNERRERCRRRWGSSDHAGPHLLHGPTR